VSTLIELVGGLELDTEASFFITCHTHPSGRSMLAAVLHRVGRLPCISPEDGEAIRPGMIYVAPAGRHLVLEPERLRLVIGPKQNRTRPAIDPLFRSAAHSYGPRVIGIVLTGLLDDGTAGLLAIKRSGGRAIIQDPREAAFPDMPRNAEAAVAIDYRLPVSEMPAVLSRLTREEVTVGAAPEPASRTLDREVKADGGAQIQMESIGRPTPFSCPDCGGVLWEIADDDLLRFRCRVGHAYSTEMLASGQDEGAEAALWAALRALEEKASFSRRMAKRLSSHNVSVSDFERRAKESDEHAAALARIIRSRKSEDPEPTS